MKLGDLIKKAYANAGKKLPLLSGGKRDDSAKKSYNASNKKQRNEKEVAHEPQASLPPAQKKPVVERIKHPQVSSSHGNTSKRMPVATRIDRFAQPEVSFNKQFELEVTDIVSPQWSDHDTTASQKLLRLNADGRHLQFTPESMLNSNQQHEIRIGLDFGTSTVKAMIGDGALKKAFAVQFIDTVGVSSYLLPTRLYLSNGVASLHEGQEVYQDLKLRLIDAQDDEDNLLRAALYLALVLRHIRAWLFDLQAPIYSQYEILWSLAIGLPSSHMGQMELTYRRLTLASWILSSQLENDLTLQCAKRIMSDLAKETSLEKLEIFHEIEIEVIPEIAAQVYGYVNSDGFDPNGQKVFLMADIGGGTVDAALFRVTKSKGKNNFQFYTTTVEATGVFYLHEYRLGWWQRALMSRDELGVFGRFIADSLSSSQISNIIPGWVQDYFYGLSLKFCAPEYSPDKVFYRNVLKQIRGDTFSAARKLGYWSQDELKNTPFYLCGGGSRVAFYAQLIGDLKQVPGYSWIRADYRRLLLPENLEAPSLQAQDYDRLSVAYGLSLGGIGSVVKELPKPPEESLVDDSWKDKYVDASMM